MKHIVSKLFTLPVLAIALTTGMSSCSKLEEKFFGSKSEYTAAAGASSADLAGVYGELNGLSGQYGWHAMNEHSTDELMGPTRGTDWDDFGTWRKLHLHTWDGAHNQVYDTWNGLNRALYKATLVAEKASGVDKAAGQFLRAFFAYHVCDLYGQVPYRASTDGPDKIPAVKTRAEAIDWIIADLDAAIPVLPSFTGAAGNKNIATKEAAKFLKMKALLNKAVYKQSPTAPAGPFTFSSADMNAVIALADEISATGKFTINNYWDNFKWDNTTASTEIIFSRQHGNGGIGDLVWPTAMGFHYGQTPGGWNGFTTLADFYDSFEDKGADGINPDVRKKGNIPGYANQVGYNPGFQVGQAYGPQGQRVGNPIVALKDRSGSPLVFTRDVSLFYSTEAKGIRTVKYPLDPSTLNDGGWGSMNEWVFFRFADVKLMKAEAILRGGTATGGETALSIVNAIRAKRNATALTAATLTTILAERGRELYLEGWRRGDLIRFEKFNDPVDQRSVKSDGSRVVYPIPVQAVSTNPNLKQNFGY